MICAIAFIAICAPSRGVEARIKRSQAAKVEFKAENPCPTSSARKGPSKGYVIDRVHPLACGGLDAPVHTQWQTFTEGKAKDKWERKECCGFE